MTRRQLAILILAISILDGFLIGAVLTATAGPAIGIPIGAGAMLLPWLVLAATGPLVWQMLSLHRVEKQFPLRDPQVFRGGRVVSMAARRPWLAANNCVEVASDDDSLHIRLALPAFSSRRGVSIPWEAITSIESGRTMSRFDIPGQPPMWLPRASLEREYELRQVQLPEEAGATVSEA